MVHFPDACNRLGQAEARSPNVDARHPNFLSFYLLAPRAHISRKLELEIELGFKPSTPAWELVAPKWCIKC